VGYGKGNKGTNDMGCVIKCPCAETCDLGREKINKESVYETLQRSIMISAIEAVDGKMSMVAEIYGSRVHACVVLGGRVRSGSAFCLVSTNMCLVKHTLRCMNEMCEVRRI
jgi:hypothetical protein